MRKTVFILLIFCALCSGCNRNQEGSESIPGQISETVPEGIVADFCHLFGLPLIKYEPENDVVKRNENFAAILQRRGVDYRLIMNLTQKAGGVFDLRKLKAGNAYTLLYEPGSSLPSYMIYEENFRTHVCFSLTDSLLVTRSEFPLEIEEKSIEVTINSSLWQDLEDAGYNPLVANGLSEVYAWTVDFFGLQKGDSFRACYQAYMLNGKEVEAGPILASAFIRSGRSLMAYRFVQDSLPGYWDPDGVNLQRAFLKAPLKYSRISSGFSYARRHPITRVVRPHTGIDYAAPSGTPVMSIGEGVVVERTYTRGGGNTVKIKHNSVYATAYLHLSRFAKGLTVGKRVAQGEVIGYVGSTGLSTGPHLDFRVWKNGKPINPLTMESPPADPVHQENMDRFRTHIASYRSYLQPEYYEKLALRIIGLTGISFK
ncbi:MAG: peptidoglycan DD-metalloendopeptidase family protein [Bacteroidales bacterium]|jgi:murein DD-endopeptidase MepM/ murein hydrolase activator NlpD|nr:peptidoglycan DD-metalloendopeptidase family protein [Bacteroidales bacterium]MDD5713369.1 peptidoglycan DD-metalloendopeptidase family protein [Bacteroidales bacterium]NLN37136.1 peptidoglycan DD-metalloendopeptidase family protein [Bacteroidales bacterium]